MVLKVRSALVGALIWLAAVAFVSVTAWLAIDRAGRDLTGDVIGPLAPVTVGRTLGSAPPQGSRSPSATPQPVVRQGSRESQGPSASPPSAPSTPSMTPQDRTINVTGGQVSVRCTGSTMTLRIAQPDNGWRVDVDKTALETVNVSFQTGDDESGAGGSVTAACLTGTPTFKVANAR
jgi:hypothetical protein